MDVCICESMCAWCVSDDMCEKMFACVRVLVVEKYILLCTYTYV